MRGCHLERQFLSSNQAETQGLARALSAGLGMGDALLLDGPVGAGKSVIAREIIRHRLEEDSTCFGRMGGPLERIETRAALAGHTGN